MKQRVTHLFVALAFAAGVVGCTTLTGESAGRNLDDTTITTSVKSKLAKEHPTTLTSVDVDTVSGTVYLTGTVPDYAAKDQAGQIAANTKGVTRVVNNLHTRSSAADAPKHGDY